MRSQIADEKLPQNIHDRHMPRAAECFKKRGRYQSDRRKRASDHMLGKSLQLKLDPSSWFTVRQSISPDSSFYRVDRNDSIASTPDGWPSESVVEIARARRMLAGFGHIDAEMQDYDLAQDASTIFAPGYLLNTRDVTFASNGSVASGCFSNVDDPSVASANSSWAIPNNLAQDFASGPSPDTHLFQAGNLTDCGINPILNTTLLNASADSNPLPYKAYAMNTIWSWAPDEPRSLVEDENPANIANRCAVLNATSSHWQSHECGNSHHAACRVNSLQGCVDRAIGRVARHGRCSEGFAGRRDQLCLRGCNNRKRIDDRLEDIRRADAVHYAAEHGTAGNDLPRNESDPERDDAVCFVGRGE